MEEIIYGVFRQGVGLWQYFLRSIGARAGEFGKCIVEGPSGEPCNKVLSMGKRRCMTGLKNHLVNVHKINIKRPHDSDDESDVPQKKAKDSLEKVLSRMSARDGLSFRALANSYDIRRMFPLGGYIIPESANTIREIVLRYASEVRVGITKELAAMKASGYLFSLTMDEWTSIRGRRYANVNIHCNGKTFCLGLVRCLGSMVAERCTELVVELIKAYGLEETDIIAITTDGAKVMVKMGRQMPFTHQLCIAHGLHLAVMDVLYAREAIAMVEVGDRVEGAGEEGQKREKKRTMAPLNWIVSNQISNCHLVTITSRA